MDKPRDISSGAKPWIEQTQPPFIRISNLTAKFGEFVAVDNVSLDIYRGELFCLLGASGCGKTTLLRMLAGFQKPSSGKIEIDGQDMASLPANMRPTNMMFQSYALFPHMSVARNIGYGLRREGVSRAETAARVAEMIKLVKLGGFENRKPAQLSGGQQQRVALARALIKRPKLLLLDEPLGALDKKLREETQFELINLQEKLGVTFIMVTHDQEEAMTLATRIGVMRNGALVQVGEPRALYEFPQDRYVADFIGSVNVFEGRVVDDSENHVRIRCGETGCDILVSHGISCTANQKLWVAVRPEKMAISHEPPGTDHNQVRGVVDEIAYLGGQSVYRIRLDNGRILRVTRTNLSRQEEDAVRWNDVVYLSWSENAGVVLTQ